MYLNIIYTEHIKLETCKQLNDCLKIYKLGMVSNSNQHTFSGKLLLNITYFIYCSKEVRVQSFTFTIITCTISANISSLFILIVRRTKIFIFTYHLHTAHLCLHVPFSVIFTWSMIYFPSIICIEYSH